MSPKPPPVPASGGFAGLRALASQAGVVADEARQRAARVFPARAPRAWLALARRADPRDPILLTALPDPRELAPHPGDLVDPVGEARRATGTYLVRKHPDRALLLVTARCHVYCRFCFRRSFPDGEHRDPTAAQLDAAFAELAEDGRVEELILSGGDPLALDDTRLAALLARIRGLPRLRRLRVHSRAPVVMPARIGPRLVELLASGPPCRLVTHANHRRELSPATSAAVARLRAAGVPVLNQAVLLAGLNDSALELEQLHRALPHHGLEAYYLHHTDHAPGNAHFRVGIERGLRLWHALCEGLEPELRPRYVIDLPDGRGKVPVETLERVSASRWRHRHADGSFSLVDEAAG